MVSTLETPRLEEERAARPSPFRILALVAAAGLVIGISWMRFFTTPDPGSSALKARGAAEQASLLEARVVADPGDTGAWHELGLTLIQAATETGNPAYYTEAQRALDQAEALVPGDPRTRAIAAALALARHDFSGAKSLAEASLADNPYDSQALVVLIDALVELGDYDRAGQRLEELLELRPALPALARLSYFRELHGDLPGAEQALVQALTAGSGSTFDISVTTTLLGDLYLKQGDLDRADERYREAEELVPGLVTARLGRARVDLARGDLDSARDLLESIVDRFPEPTSLILLGKIHDLEGREEEAANAFATVRLIADLQREAGADVDLELARFEAEHGDPVQAVTLAQSVYDARPTIFAAQVLGRALHRAGRSEEALAFSEESLRLGTLDASLLLQAGEIYEANGLTALGLEIRSRAAGLDPWYPVVYATGEAA